MTFINILIIAIWKSRQAFRAYGWGNMPLQAAKLPTCISGSQKCGGREHSSPTHHFGDWCSHTRGSEFISNSTSSRWRWIMNHSCENTSLQNVSVENLQISPTRDWEQRVHYTLWFSVDKQISPTRDWEQHSRESVLLLLGWEQECSHIRVWEHPGEF